MRLAIVVLASMLLVGLHATRSHAQEAATPAPAAPEAEIPTAPVRIDDRVLFRVRGTTSYPAAERATSIEARILEVAGNPE